MNNPKYGTAGPQYVERPLYEEERTELARLARVIRVKPLWIAVPLSLWFWPVFLASLWMRRFPDVGTSLSYLLLGAVTVYWERQVFVGSRLSKALWRDIEAGVIMCDPQSGREILPISGMAWSLELYGAPAEWRGHPPPTVDESAGRNDIG